MTFHIMIAGEFKYREYTTIVKALAAADLDIMDLIHRQQEITKTQCELIQEKKSNLIVELLPSID